MRNISGHLLGTGNRSGLQSSLDCILVSHTIYGLQRCYPPSVGMSKPRHKTINLNFFVITASRTKQAFGTIILFFLFHSSQYIANPLSLAIMYVFRALDSAGTHGLTGAKGMSARKKHKKRRLNFRCALVIHHTYISCPDDQKMPKCPTEQIFEIHA
ncbi:hypothetical protein, variant [Blastomyces gilchristii SLH14081]|uniref:Uncharacterized protein n=1 Tax=Blastomyces gilchristii (strain SLH14081) TaxID=559298 RepID=A0A179V1K3_BLAGS|nr:hypothetical protein, variant [Blastomyces gilchristii SLH14081]OAT13277.1 hypothetical protein, variant [Blastomyces gilchristii SLH14081]